MRGFRRVRRRESAGFAKGALAALVCVGLTTACLPDWRGPAAGPRVAAVGDSILHELQHSGPAYPDSNVALTRSMIDEGWRSTVRGENGWTIQWVRALATDAAGQGAEGIIIVAGVNDLSWVSRQPNRRVARDYVQAQIRATLDEAATARCIVWPTIMQTGRQVTARAINTTLRNQDLRRANLVVPEWGRRLASNSQWLAADGLHLSESGEAGFQSLLLGAMRTCLGTAPPPPTTTVPTTTVPATTVPATTVPMRTVPTTTVPTTTVP